MQQLDYQPPMMFSLFPAPGPPLGLGELSDGLMSVSIFEPNGAVLDQYPPEVAEIVAEFSTRAEEEVFPTRCSRRRRPPRGTPGRSSPRASRPPAASTSRPSVARCTRTAETTFSGPLEFDPEVNNFWPSNEGLKQIQDGDWLMVWPAERAAAELQPPAG